MSQEALIILDASVVAQPNAVSSLTDRFQSSYKVHRQVLDRLSSKTVLPNHYAYIFRLTIFRFSLTPSALAAVWRAL